MAAKRRSAYMVSAILGMSLYCYISSVRPDAALSTPKRMMTMTTTTESSSPQQGYSKLRNRVSKVKERECTIFVAPSSLKGNPGYGIYTTRDLWKGEKILGGPDGLSIPVESYQQLAIPKGQLKSKWIELWDPYWWGRGVPDHVTYEAGPDIVDFQIGFGYLPNHHCELSSLNPEYPGETAPYDDSLANRFDSPGAGAFSYNVGREFTSTRDVKAGEELFMSYGYCQHGMGPSWTNKAYMPAEFEKASDIIWRHIGPRATRSFEFDESGKVVLDLGLIEEKDRTAKANLVKELLPETKEQVQKMAAAPLTRADLPSYLAQTRGVNHRTPDWVREHGMCLETMKAKKSSLPHAGQGGFAQLRVKQGDIISVAPLLHIMDRDVLALYDSDESGENRQIGTQLLLNYCFANPHSTVLLCPTTNAVLINHCSNRTKQCGPNGPNANYRWSSGWDPTSDEWRTQSLDELAEKKYRGLSMEIYALRDIQLDEEIFLDYGIEWERAWERHVETWQPPQPTISNWISAKEANENNNEPIFNELMVGKENMTQQVVEHPYLMTGCVYWPTELDLDNVFETPSPNWETDMTVTDMLDTYADDGSFYQYTDSRGYSGHEDGLHWPCTVLWPDNDEDDDGGDIGTDYYVVRIHPSPMVSENDLPWAKNRLPRILETYPRESIRYFVKPYASDQHLPGVFRQPIGMRNDLFPEQWKNIG